MWAGAVEHLGQFSISIPPVGGSIFGQRQHRVRAIHRFRLLWDYAEELFRPRIRHQKEADPARPLPREDRQGYTLSKLHEQIKSHYPKVDGAGRR